MKTVAAYLAEFLASQNVKHIFGYQGSAMLKLLDEICLQGKTKYVQSFHEQASSFSASSYARVSGGYGVAIATSGPGAVNLIGGIADAYFDSVPCLFITGQDYTSNLLNNQGTRQVGFQDMNIVKMVETITKHAVMITDPNDIAYHLEKAVWMMTDGRMGPVLLDIPIDIQFAEIDELNLRHFTPEEKISNDMMGLYTRAAQLLKNAQRPLVIAGGGIQLSGAVDVFRNMISKTKIPVVTTLNGLDTAESSYGFSGLYGQTHANLAVYKADVIIALGTRFAQRQAGKIPRKEYTNAAIIHIDIDKHELGRVMDEDISICEGLGSAIPKLHIALSECGFVVSKAWLNCLEKWKKELLPRLEINKNGVDPIKFVQYLSGLCGEDVIVTADIGQNQMWAAQGLVIKPKWRIVNSGGFGSMGFSVPAAVGASYVDSKATIIAFTGDGGFHMNMQELQFLAIHRPNIKCVIFNNENLGLMREVSKRYYSEHYFGNTSTEFQCANIRGLADSYNLPYCCVDSESAFFAINSLISTEGPCLIECRLSVDAGTVNRYDESIIYREYED